MERFLDEIGLENIKATINITHLWLMRYLPTKSARYGEGLRTCTFRIATE